MKKVFYILCFWNLMLVAKGQNLVPNPSFEQLHKQPCKLIYKQEYFGIHLKEWSLPTLGTSDIFSLDASPDCQAFPAGDVYFDMEIKNNSIFGIQMPQDGKVMAGLITYLTNTNYREYLQAKLLSPMEAGTTYYVDYWAARANEVRYASNNLGIYFSDTLVKEPTFRALNQFTPQLNQNTVLQAAGWRHFADTITLTKNANYIIIGNFFLSEQTQTVQLKNPQNTNQQVAYYFIDNLRITPLGSMTNRFAGTFNQQFELPKAQQLEALSAPSQTEFVPSELIRLSATNFIENKPDKLENNEEWGRLVAVLLENQTWKVRVYVRVRDGESDNLCLKLSEKRAQWLKKLLIQAGIADWRVESEGYGCQQDLKETEVELMIIN